MRRYFAAGLPQDLRDAGLVDVQEKRIQIRLGRSIVGDAALYERSIASPGLPHFARRFCTLAFSVGVDVDGARLYMLPERLESDLRELETADCRVEMRYVERHPVPYLGPLWGNDSRRRLSIDSVYR